MGWKWNDIAALDASPELAAAFNAKKQELVDALLERADGARAESKGHSSTFREGFFMGQAAAFLEIADAVKPHEP